MLSAHVLEKASVCWVAGENLAIMTRLRSYHSMGVLRGACECVGVTVSESVWKSMRCVLGAGLVQRVGILEQLWVTCQVALKNDSKTNISPQCLQIKVCALFDIFPEKMPSGVWNACVEAF